MKTKLEKNKYILLLIGITLLICWILVLQYGVFGSKVDWISQHSVLPDYFRQLFYDTGQLFPDFAPNLGGGQNIYYFAYYGLLNPIIIFSYLLPFIEMGHYIMLVSILSLIVSSIIMYKWLEKKFSRELSFGIALIFLLATPMLYHAYNQIMFVNYMPFLCLAFAGIDRYFEQKKSGLYIMATFLMIMTSFYFSIGGMLVLLLYGISEYVRLEKRITVKRFFVDGVRFLLPMLTAVFMSSVLLIPTFIALLGSRTGTEKTAISELLFPRFSLTSYIYTPYGMGLITISITVLLIGLFYKKAHERVLSYGLLIIFTIPIFGFLLNGGLYVRDKVFIPFLPLVCYLIGYHFQKLKEEKSNWIKYAMFYGTTVLILVFYKEQPTISKYWKYLVIEALLMCICLGFYIKFRKIGIFLYPIVGIMLCYGISVNYKAAAILPKEVYKNATNTTLGLVVKEIQEQDSTYYRMEQIGNASANAENINRIHDSNQKISSFYSSMYNKNYMDFRYQTFQIEQPFRNRLMQSVSSNPLFLRFMGVKYVVGDYEPAGYKKFKTKGKESIHVNEHVSPLGYVTDQLISNDSYSKLEFPYNQIALLEQAVIPEIGLGEELKSKLTPIDFLIPEEQENYLSIQKNKEEYVVQSKKSTTIKLEVPEEMKEGKLLFLKFEVINNKPNKDVHITVENVKNKISAKQHFYYNDNTEFTYVTGISKEQKELSVTFSEGNYNIKNIKCYIGNVDEKQNALLYQQPFEVLKKETRGNKIVGNIFAKKKSYFISTIPHDKNFVITVDGKQIDYKKVNTAFVGFPVTGGKHRIEITYKASGKMVGQTISVIGLLMLGFQIYGEKKVRRKRI